MAWSTTTAASAPAAIVVYFLAMASWNGKSRRRAYAHVCMMKRMSTAINYEPTPRPRRPWTYPTPAQHQHHVHQQKDMAHTPWHALVLLQVEQLIGPLAQDTERVLEKGDD